MSEQNNVKDFVDSIASGNNIDAESHFNNALAQKVGAALETKRQEIAAGFVTQHVPDAQEEDA